MEITASSALGSATGCESMCWSSYALGHRGGSRWASCRSFVWLIAVPVALSSFSTPASAHGAASHGGTPVTFAVVVGLPVTVGLIAGVTAIAVRRRTDGTGTGHRSTGVLGLLLLFLGGAFAIEAATRSPWLALVGGAVGGIGVLAISAHGGVPQGGEDCHAELACGAISLHRVLEGLAIGALYSAGAVVGVLGAVAIAGHTVLETGAVGSQYCSYRQEALVAIGVVQLGYAGGAIAGVGLSATIPVSVRSALLGLIGGALFAVGTDKTRNSTSTHHAAERT